MLDVSGKWRLWGVNLLPLVGMVGAAPVCVAVAPVGVAVLQSKLAIAGGPTGEAATRLTRLASARLLRMVDIEGILR